MAWTRLRRGDQELQPSAPVPPPPSDGNYDNPNYYPALGWTFDDCTNAVYFWAVRPEADRPCEPPYPCDVGNGYLWRPGVMEPVTHYAQRAIDLLHTESEYINAEVCHKQIGGGCVLRPDGRVQPLFCNDPEVGTSSLSALEGERYARGYGIRSDQKRGTLFSQHSHGVMGVFAYQTPPWVEARLFSWYPFCGMAAG